MTIDSNRLMQAMERMMSTPEGWPGAYEQYNSQTGIPFGVADYSWSGAIDDYLVRWVAGMQPDAPRNMLVIAPHLFSGWKWFELDRVHVGHDEFGYRYEELPGRTRIRVSQEGLDKFTIELVLPGASAPQRVLIDGSALPSAAWRMEGGQLHIVVPGNGVRTVEVVK